MPFGNSIKHRLERSRFIIPDPAWNIAFSRTGLALAHGSNSAGLLCFCDHGSSFTQYFVLGLTYGLPCCCSLREPTGIVVFLRLEYDFRRSSVPEHAFRLIMARDLEH